MPGTTTHYETPLPGLPGLSFILGYRCLRSTLVHIGVSRPLLSRQTRPHLSITYGNFRAPSLSPDRARKGRNGGQLA